MQSHRTVQSAVVGKLIPAFLFVLSKRVSGLDLEGLRTLMISSAVVMD